MSLAWTRQISGNKREMVKEDERRRLRRGLVGGMKEGSVMAAFLFVINKSHIPTAKNRNAVPTSTFPRLIEHMHASESEPANFM